MLGISLEYCRSKLSLAAASSNSAAMTFGLLAAASALASSSVAHRQAQRLRLDQRARQLADQALVLRARGLQVAFGGLPRGGGAGQRRLGLGDVGAGDFADPEAVVGGLQLPGQHLLVVDVQRQHLLVGDDADIGGGRCR